MASRPLQSVRELEAAVVARLARRASARTCGDAVMLPLLQLMDATGLSFEEGKKLVAQVAQVVRPACRTALELARDGVGGDGGRPQATGLPTFDRRTRGGVHRGAITELVGAAGVGKTQLCMTLAVLATAPKSLGGCGDDASVVYLDTENKFSAVRLLEIAKARFPNHYGSPAAVAAGTVSEDEAMARCASLATRVKLVTVTSVAAFMRSVKALATQIIEDRVALVVVDSMAAIPRREFGSNAYVQRQDVLNGTAAALKSCADRFNIPVLATNQVTAGSASHAALGNTWAHCVNTRLSLVKEGDTRWLHVTKSPVSSSFRVMYCIEERGTVEQRVVAQDASGTGATGGEAWAPEGEGRLE